MKIWKVTKDQRDTLENVDLMLVAILEGAINISYHTTVMAMGAMGFSPLMTSQIISRMKLNYRKPGFGEIKNALLRLNDPMDFYMPIEVMLQSLEEV